MFGPCPADEYGPYVRYDFASCAALRPDPHRPSTVLHRPPPPSTAPPLHSTPLHSTEPNPAPASHSPFLPGSRQATAAAALPDAAAQLQAMQARLQLWVGRHPAAVPYLAAVNLTELLAAAPAAGGATAAVGPAAVRLLQQLPWDPDSTKVALDVAVVAAAAGGEPSAAAPAVSRLRLHLDLLLPHAARLAEESPDLQARSAAAELLHAAALWVVGANAALPEELGGPGAGGGRQDGS